MEEPLASGAPRYAIDAHDLSTLFAPLLPRGADDVRPFLMEAAYALGEREADLARTLAVSPATFASWKRRGTIPDAHLRWFRERFAVEVLLSRDPPQHMDFRHAGGELTLHLLKATDFDPFKSENSNIDYRILDCTRYLGPLMRLSLFVMHRIEAGPDMIGRGLKVLRPLVASSAYGMYSRVSQSVSQ